MKFTTSSREPKNIFGFEDAETPFNFEVTENKSLADLIPEIDALYGAVQYPSFECFEQNPFEGNVDIYQLNEMEGNQSDLNVDKEDANQSLMQTCLGIIPQIIHSEAQSPEVDKVFIKSLKKDNSQDMRDEFEHQLQNENENSNKSNERRSKKDLKGSNQLNSINEEVKLKTRKNKTRINKVIVHRQHGVKLKRWGRGEDKKVFSY